MNVAVGSRSTVQPFLTPSTRYLPTFNHKGRG